MLGAAAALDRLAFVTLVPLVWLVAVTFTAGVEKIWIRTRASDFWRRPACCMKSRPRWKAIWMRRKSSVMRLLLPAPKKRCEPTASLRFNNLLDAAVAGTFLVLVTAIILLSVREWILLLSRRKPAVLHETEPVWLPDYALKEAGPDLRTVAGTAALAFGLAKELSGEAHFERARQQACECARPSDQQIFTQATEARFNGVRRCC